MLTKNLYFFTPCRPGALALALAVGVGGVSLPRALTVALAFEFCSAGSGAPPLFGFGAEMASKPKNYI